MSYKAFKAGDRRYKAAAGLDEKMNLATADMGHVIKDFQQSDAPQFQGKSKKERREMAIAAVLTARRGGKKLGEENEQGVNPKAQQIQKRQIQLDRQKLQMKMQQSAKKQSTPSTDIISGD